MNIKFLANNVLRWSIFVVCAVFLVYKIAGIENYSDFTLIFKELTLERWAMLFIAFVLLVSNFFIESIKWKVLLKHTYNISLAYSAKTVLWGQTGAFITPNSIGEYPTRTLNLPEGRRTEAIILGFCGSIVQTTIVVICGIMAVLLVKNASNEAIFTSKQINVIVGTAVIFVLGFCSIFLTIKFSKTLSNSNIKIIKNIVETIKFFSFGRFALVFALCLCRYFIFNLQFYIVLVFCGADIALTQAAIALSIFYLILTFIPLVNIFEVVVRSSVAIFVFSFWNVEVSTIVLGSTIFWLMNFVIPAIVGLFFVKRRGKNTSF